MSKPTKFTIDRSKWARGAYPQTLLRDQAGMMCCLGQYALACGVPSGGLLDVPSYRGLATDDRNRIPLEFDEDSASGPHDRLTAANDNPGIAESVRESRITELFASIGVEVEFVDGVK